MATVVAGLLGGSWISRWFDHRPPAHAPSPPSLRRSARALLQLEIVTPDGDCWRPCLRADLGVTTLDEIDIRQRRLALTLHVEPDATLRVRASATADNTLAAFTDDVFEDQPTVWRLAVEDGLTTIRADLWREYAES